MGYLLPTENVMQFLGFGLALFAFAGGVFIPLSQFSHLFRTIAEYTPLYGLNQLVHAPLIGGASSWPGSSTPSPGCSSSPAARSGGSARTPPGSEPAPGFRSGAGTGCGTARGPPHSLHRPAGGLVLGGSVGYWIRFS